MTFPHVNDVVLIGRLSGEPARRTLPSGDVLVTWRLVVERPPGRRERSAVDTLGCVSFENEVQDEAARWRHGDLIEARGSLRRRFWRTRSGAGVDRCEVQVREVRLVAVAAGAGQAGSRTAAGSAGVDQPEQ